MSEPDAMAAIESAHGALIDALEHYRELLTASSTLANATTKPNPKLLAIYDYAIEGVDRTLAIVDREVAEKILLMINTRFSLKQAESPGGMIKLGVITDETPDEVAKLRDVEESGEAGKTSSD